MTQSTTPLCFFHGCTNVRAANSPKCDAHKHRAKCTVADCFNQVYARNLCVRHGGKKQCAFDGCQGNARAGPFCCRHNTTASKKRFCSAPGCSHVARAKGLCVSHGGGRKCEAGGCASYARDGGYCRRHRVQRSPTPTPSFKIEEPACTPQSFKLEQSSWADNIVFAAQNDAGDYDTLSSVFRGTPETTKTTVDMGTVCFDTTWGLDFIEASVLDAILAETTAVMWC
ncbi:Aste57867_12882 [Aphanomyces stellatus]|uniref:Aste57867_12882 protein n=1 Tax=Aphanomyces stellatus TaxID=120398 RepID=A0A485KWS3_9STRA|nr:hypothetical protein As57867_012834 [Aphanomyces stellatus]VFT89729.1 Aste57867_12882 [Aphanomyces stellatus]